MTHRNKNQILDFLESSPSAHLWNKLWISLDGNDEALNQLVNEVDSKLENWPFDLRVAPKPKSYGEEADIYWLKESKKPRWRLVRNFYPYGVSLGLISMQYISTAFVRAPLLQLNLNGKPFSKTGFNHFLEHELPHLKHLSLYDCNLNASQIGRLLKNKRITDSLESLVLNRNAVSDANIKSLCSLQHLEGIHTLKISDSNVSDKGAKILASSKLPLQYVNISHSKVEQAGILAILKGIKTLKRIEMKGLELKQGAAKILYSDFIMEKEGIYVKKSEPDSVPKNKADSRIEEELQALLDQHPTEQGWEAIWKRLDGQSDSALIEVADKLLESWPNALRINLVGDGETSKASFWLSESIKPRWTLIRTFRSYGVGKTFSPPWNTFVDGLHESISHLELNRIRLDSKLIKLLCTKSFSNLKSLDLSDSDPKPRDVVQLLDSAGLTSSLETLDLSGWRLDKLGMSAIVKQLPGLQRLRLANGGKSGTGAGAAFFVPENSFKLRELDLSNSYLNGKSFTRMPELPMVKSVEQLLLADNRIDLKTATMIVIACPDLKRLDMSENKLSTNSRRKSAHKPPVNLKKKPSAFAKAIGDKKELKALYLAKGLLGPMDIESIAKLEQITELDLSGNRVGLRGMKSILHSPFASQLRILRLANSEIGNIVTTDGRKWFMKKASSGSPEMNESFALLSKLESLEELDLRLNRIHPEHAPLLASVIPNVKRLCLGGQSIRGGQIIEGEAVVGKNYGNREWIPHTDLSGQIGVILRSGRLRRVNALYLQNLCLSNDDLEAVGTASGVAGLRHIYLNCCVFDLEALKRLLDSPNLKNLNRLYIDFHYEMKEFEKQVVEVIEASAFKSRFENGLDWEVFYGSDPVPVVQFY